jgi:hypothetical protein
MRMLLLITYLWLMFVFVLSMFIAPDFVPTAIVLVVVTYVTLILEVNYGVIEKV